jgi:hypothetical protein
VTTPSPSGSEPGDEVLLRGRALAQHADVKALVMLREATAQRAGVRGEPTSPEQNPVLAELDRRLAEARLMRLKLDAEEFRNAKTDPTKPR